MSTHELFGEPIYTYTRAQAIEDGTLADLTPWARETGFTVPVAITAAAWEDFIAWPDDAEPAGLGQSERGRAHDVLWMLHVGIKSSRGGSRVDFQVARIVRGPRFRGEPKPRIGNLYALSHPGDNGEHVITIMLPDED